MAMHGRRPAEDEEDPNRPTLRRKSSGRVDAQGNEIPSEEDEDERPTLKRRN